MPIDAEGTSPSHHAVRIRWMIQVTIPPTKMVKPPAMAHWNIRTRRSDASCGRSMSQPPLGRHGFWLSCFREIGQQPLLHLLEAYLTPLLDFPDRNDGENLGEEQIKESKQGKACRGLPPLDPGRPIDPLGEWEPGVRQGGNDDDETFEPHPNDDRQRSGQDLADRATFKSHQAEKRDDEVGEDHTPEEQRERPPELPPEDLHLLHLTAVIARQVLGEGEVKPKKRHD